MKLIILLFVLVVGMPLDTLHADSKNLRTDDKIEQFARTYKLATSEHEKRGLCMKAIDAGLFSLGSPVKVVDRLFGTNFDIDFIAAEKGGVGTIKFAPQFQGKANEQIPFVGWYLAVEWDKNKTVCNFYLSNLHK